MIGESTGATRSIHLVSASTTTTWHLLRTQTRKELQVDRYLRDHGIETYLPLKVVGVRQNEPVREPFFPSYLFFRCPDGGLVWPLIRWAPGTRQVVAFDGEPATVPAAVVELIRERLNASDGTTPATVFRRGDRVRVIAGPLAGLEAVFEEGLSGRHRALILVEMLGRLVRTQVPVEHLRCSG